MLIDTACILLVILASVSIVNAINIGGLGAGPVTDSPLTENGSEDTMSDLTVTPITSANSVLLTATSDSMTATPKSGPEITGSTSYNQYGFTGSQSIWEASSMKVSGLSTSHGTSLVSRSTSSSSHSKSSGASSTSISFSPRQFQVAISFIMVITIGCTLNPM